MYLVFVKISLQCVDSFFLPIFIASKLYSTREVFRFFQASFVFSGYNGKSNVNVFNLGLFDFLPKGNHGYGCACENK